MANRSVDGLREPRQAIPDSRVFYAKMSDPSRNADIPPPGMEGRAEFTPELMLRGWIVHTGWRGPVTRVLIFLFAVTFLIFSLYFLWKHEWLSGVILLGCALVLFYYSVFAVSRIGRVFRKQFSQMGKETEVVFFQPTDEYLRLQTDDVDLRLKWSDLHQWKEQDHLILAYRHERLYQLIPVEQLSDETVSMIRNQLQQHVKRA